jgi:hypothetical protein
MIVQANRRNGARLCAALDRQRCHRFGELVALRDGTDAVDWTTDPCSGLDLSDGLRLRASQAVLPAG